VKPDRRNSVQVKLSITEWTESIMVHLARTLFAVLLMAVGTVPLQARTPPGPQRPPRADSVEAFLQTQMVKRRIPGLQVAVVRDGRILFLGAYGLANVEHSVPATNRTIFSINSATKAFTGVAIMQLVEEGKLDVAAPVSRYLDGGNSTAIADSHLRYSGDHGGER